MVMGNSVDSVFTGLSMVKPTLLYVRRAKHADLFLGSLEPAVVHVKLAVTEETPATHQQMRH